MMFKIAFPASSHVCIRGWSILRIYVTLSINSLGTNTPTPANLVSSPPPEESVCCVFSLKNICRLSITSSFLNAEYMWNSLYIYRKRSRVWVGNLLFHSKTKNYIYERTFIKLDERGIHYDKDSRQKPMK